MNCKRHSGESNVRQFAKKASTAFSFGDIVFVDSNGLLDKAAAATTASSIVGVIQKTVAATDADYASNTLVPVDCFRKGDEGEDWELEVGTGTAAQTHVGETHDLTAAGKADLTAAAVNVYKVQRVIAGGNVFVTFLNTDATA